jgi:hypothetical protein
MGRQKGNAIGGKELIKADLLLSWREAREIIELRRKLIDIRLRRAGRFRVLRWNHSTPVIWTTVILR